MHRQKNNQPTVVETLLRYLENEGVDHIFGIPGGPLMPLYEAIFATSKIRPILAKHEEGAAFMADGYARVRRGLGVCCATTGPGATNALTGLACSAMDSVPVILLTAQVPTWSFGKGAAQESSAYAIDIVSLYKDVVKKSVMLVNNTACGDNIRGLLRCALSGRPGPVHLNIPADLAKRPGSPDIRPVDSYRSTAQNFDRQAVRQTAQALLRAKRPAIIAGHGVALSGAFTELRRIAEQLCAPVATSPKGKACFPEDHLLSLGVLGFAGSPQAERYFNSDEVDVLLVVGSGLGEQVTNAWDPRLAPTDTFIQIDVDPEQIGRNYPVTHGIVGDARSVLTELRYQLEREARWTEAGTPAPAKEALIRGFKSQLPRLTEPAKLDDATLPLKPPRLMRDLQEALPSDAILFVDIGNCMAWAIHYLKLTRPGSFIVNMGFASMGHAVAAAIGGKLAAPERPVIAIVGDASFAMNGFEVHTAVENDVPVVWLVLNNGGLGMVYHGERIQFGGKFVTSRFAKPMDVAAMARAMGAQAHVVEKPDELQGVLRSALKSGRPTVIDARVDIEACPPTADRFRTLDKFMGKSSAATQEAAV
ncbi:MAG: thiamine pyrophosphate-binding protein [Elusimicrobiota bacterium]